MSSLKLLSVAALVILEVGCGLPSPYFLGAPTVPTLAAGASTATFFSPGYNPTGTLTTFVGFEVYYKFLASLPSGTDINLGGGGFPGPSVLQQNGYYPICLSTDRPPISRTAPALAIAFADSQGSLTITLTISSSVNAPSTYSYNTSLQLCRYVSYPTASTSKAFNSAISTWPSAALSTQNYQPGDPDVASIYPQASPPQSLAYVNLYVLAYGYQTGTTVVQYSPPTYLGYVYVTPFP